MTYNTNLIHNVLNIVGLIIGLFLVYDFTALGFSPQTAALIAGWTLFLDKIIKLGINITRDGVTGLFKEQPPVQ